MQSNINSDYQTNIQWNTETNIGRLFFSTGNKSYTLKIYNVPENRLQGKIQANEWRELARLVEQILTSTGLLENGNLAKKGACISNSGASNLEDYLVIEQDISLQYQKIVLILMGESKIFEENENKDDLKLPVKDKKYLKREVAFLNRQLMCQQEHLKNALLKIREFEKGDEEKREELEIEREKAFRLNQLLLERNREVLLQN